MSDVVQFISQIETICGDNYSDMEEQIIKNHLRDRRFSREHFHDALKVFEEGGDFSLPNPKQMLALVESSRNKIGSVEKQREKVDPASKVQAQMGMKLVGLILSGKATRGQIIENMKKADGVRPGTGWMTEAENLERYYDKCGLDLDQKPANYFDYGLCDEAL